MVLALEKPVLKSSCYDDTSSLAKILTSRSRGFYFPPKTYTHGTTSPFPTADPRVAAFWRKYKQTLDISRGT